MMYNIIQNIKSIAIITDYQFRGWMIWTYYFYLLINEYKMLLASDGGGAELDIVVYLYYYFIYSALHVIHITYACK